MIERISRKFHAWTTGRRVVLLLIATALMSGYVMPLAGGLIALAANNSVTPLDLMFLYTPATAFDMIEKYGPAGRDLYMRVELTADILYPLLYTLLLGFLISWLFRRAFPPGSSMQKWNAMPVGAWLFDLFENAGIVAMLAMYPSIPAGMAWMTMLAGTVKWLFAFLSLGLVLLGLARAAMNRFRTQAGYA